MIFSCIETSVIDTCTSERLDVYNNAPSSHYEYNVLPILRAICICKTSKKTFWYMPLNRDLKLYTPSLAGRQTIAAPEHEHGTKMNILHSQRKLCLWVFTIVIGIYTAYALLH